MTTEVHETVERIGAALTSAGLARLPSRVFAALLADDDGRMTSAELVEVLAVSPAAVSGAVKFLEHLGWSRRERERGSRRDVYVVEEDAWQRALLQTEQTYGPIRQAMDAAVCVAGPQARRRLTMSREFLVFVQEEMSAMAGRWDERRRQLEAELG